jgi:RimJ/RimL family protein N-acetyltransferase
MEQKKLPGRINGERIYLQRHSSALAPEMFKLIDENREHLKGMPWIRATQTVDNSRAWISATLAEWDNLSLFDYGIYLAASDQYLGSFGIHSINWEFQTSDDDVCLHGQRQV